MSEQNQQNDNQQKEKKSGGFNPIGLCLGLSIGVCFGTALDNMGLGLCLGMSIGVCFAVALGRKKEDK